MNAARKNNFLVGANTIEYSSYCFGNELQTNKSVSTCTCPLPQLAKESGRRNCMSLWNVGVDKNQW